MSASLNTVCLESSRWPPGRHGAMHAAMHLDSPRQLQINKCSAMRTRNRFLPVGVSLSSEVTSSALKKKKKKSQPASIDSLGQSKQELCFVVIWCRGTFFLIFFSAWSWQVQTLRPRLVAPIRPGTASIPAETKWPGLQPDLGWNPRSFWAARIENGLDSASFRPITARFQSPPPTLRIQSGSTRRGEADGTRQAARSWATAREREAGAAELRRRRG